MIIKNGNVFLNDNKFSVKDIHICDEVISQITEHDSAGSENIVDASNCYVIPGFVDIHIHGAFGADFSDGNTEAVDTMAKHLLSVGVTSFLGTTMSLPECDLQKSMVAARAYERGGSKADLLGVNMEGPFISKQKRGAQNEAYITSPDYDMFDRLNKASGNMIRLVDVAPETDENMRFIARASYECAVSIAHTTADYDTAVRAFNAGASHVTHLFNAMPPFLHRDTGVVGAAFDKAKYVELISDGIHISPSAIRTAFKLFGADRICLISDAVRALGLGSGSYMLGGLNVCVDGSRATLDDGTLAGSVTCLADCVRKTVSFGVPLEDAVRAATKNPCDAIGENERGVIYAGKIADILLLDKKLNLCAVIKRGRVLAK